MKTLAKLHSTTLGIRKTAPTPNIPISNFTRFIAVRERNLNSAATAVAMLAGTALRSPPPPPIEVELEFLCQGVAN